MRIRRFSEQGMEEIRTCCHCHLWHFRRNVVIGRGSIPATILFLGEAPGNGEDATGIPFFGPSGKLLDSLLAASGFDVSYFISNTILCHPTDKIGGKNREPLEVEAFSCRGNVIRIFEAVDPKLTIFVGKVAESYYKKVFKPNVTILHPAYLLRTGGRSSPYYQLTINKLWGIKNKFLKG